MRTHSTLTLALLLTGASLIGQNSGNVIFTAQGGAAGAIGGGFTTGAMGVPGPRTFAFVAGELSGNTVKGAPYSAQAATQTTQTLADGNQIVNSATATIYRDADGRERREQSLPNIGPFAAQDASVQTVFISDPVAGVNYSLNPGEHVAIKLPVPQTVANGANGKIVTMQRTAQAIGAGLPMPGPGPVFIYRSASSAAPDHPVVNVPVVNPPVVNPPVVEQLGSQSIQGVQAEGTRTTVTIPAGQMGNSLPIQIVDEVWRSSDLQVIVQSAHSDPRMGTTTYTLSNISRADPSPALFHVPPDYTIQDAPVMNMQKTTTAATQQ